MNSQRLRLALLGLIGLSIVAFIAIMFLGLSRLSQKSQKLVDLKLQSKVAEAQLTSLKQAKKQLAQYGYFKDIAKTVIPSDKDQAQAVADIFQIANESGIAISTITFPSSSLGGSSGAAPATGSSSSAVTAPTTGASNAISQAKPVTGSPGLYGMELTITPQTATVAPADKQVTYDKMIDFLRRIEHNRRTAQISQVNLQPQGGKGNEPIQSINFTLTVDIFIKPAKL